MTEEQYRNEAEFYVKVHSLYGRMDAEIGSDERSRFEAEVQSYIAGRSKTDADLQSRLTAAEERVPKWISVKDQLPEHLTRVLVEGGIAYYHAAQEIWWTITGCDSPLPIRWEVTHWMPLPKFELTH